MSTWTRLSPSTLRLAGGRFDGELHRLEVLGADVEESLGLEDRQDLRVVRAVTEPEAEGSLGTVVRIAILGNRRVGKTALIGCLPRTLAIRPEVLGLFIVFWLAQRG